MVSPNRGLLAGVIEADEAFIGGSVKGKKGRGVSKDENVVLIAGAVEVVEYKEKSDEIKQMAGRLRLEVLKSADEVEIKKFLNKNIEKKSIVKSDGWRGYSAYALEGYKHDHDVLPKNYGVRWFFCRVSQMTELICVS